MNIYEITFSPTGGTQKVSLCLSRPLQQMLNCEIIPVDLTDPDANFENLSFVEDDLCVISVPSYGGRVPQAALTRLAQLKGAAAKAVLVAVYGNRDYEDTLLELQEAARRSGFSCIAAVAAVAEHSIMRQFASGRPDAADAAELAAFCQAIADKYRSGEIAEPSLPGNTPYKEYRGIPMKPMASEGCKGCGLCAQKCPVGAIAQSAPEQTDEALCISCMRCLSVCPSGARSVNPQMLAATVQRLEKACSEPKQNQLFL